MNTGFFLVNFCRCYLLNEYNLRFHLHKLYVTIVRVVQLKIPEHVISEQVSMHHMIVFGVRRNIFAFLSEKISVSFEYQVLQFI